MDTYTPSQRLQFARAILAPNLFDHNPEDYLHHLKDILQYWGIFVPFAPRVMLASEGEVEYVESLYDQMRPYVFEWMMGYRLNELETRIEALEQPNGELQ